MRNIRIVVSFLLFCLGQVMAFAQTLTITGKVVDEEGLEVIGANIRVKGNATVGTITSIDGTYSIRAGAKDVLQFSYIGMASQDIPIKGRTKIDVQLKQDNKVLDEVVVIGYGTSKRSDLTGSVVSVKSDDLMKNPVSDVTQALAGRVAGVQVTQSEGGPGAGISIRVRGGMSITQSNEPLYVIDGFPSEDGLADLDPGEIESIDILKDASATAIYGARGANGVVVVTTKGGKEKKDTKLTVSFDAYVGVARIARQLPVLSSEEFAILDYERNYFSTNSVANSSYIYSNEGLQRFQNTYGAFREIHDNYAHRGIDWQDIVLGRTTTSQNYRVNVSGGGRELNYNLNYAYYKELGAMMYSGTNKHNISLSFSQRGDKRLSVNGRITFSQTKVNGSGTSDGDTRFNRMEGILQYPPIAGITATEEELLEGENPLYEDDASNTMQNPLIEAEQTLDNRTTRVFQANGGVTFRFNKRWFLRSTLGSRYQTIRRDQFYGELTSYAKRSSINGSVQYSESGSFQSSNVLNYEYKSKTHRLNLMFGQEWVSRWSQWVRSRVTNLPNNDIALDDMSLGTPSQVTSNVNFDDKLLSFFSRANWNFKERFLLTATIRADGSSKFARNHKWGFFPSISGAWRLSEEEFVKKLNVFSDLKLRAGYGLAGNNRVASYSSLDLLQSATYPSGESVSAGYAPRGIPSVELQWESNKTLNVGVDMGFLGQRITISPEFYLNKSSHLLLNSKVPTSSGYSTMLRNIGKTRNIGFDLSISSVNIQSKDFSWSTDLNLSFNRNRIEALSGEDYFLEEAAFGYNQNTHKIAVGEPLGQFYGFKTLGLYQVEDFTYDAATGTYTLKDGVPGRADSNVLPGSWKFADTDGNGIVDDNDRTVIGNANPDFYGGITNNFSYKGFDLSVFFAFSYGAEVLNATKLSNTKTGNQNKNVLELASSSNRWMTVDADGNAITDPETLQAVNAGKTVAFISDQEQGDYFVHSWAVEDASYLRLSNLTLGYTFPRIWAQKMNLSKLRLYFTGSNLFVWTPYTGFDPEVSTKGSNLTPGVDFGAYPRNRSFVFGVNLTF